MVKPDWDSLLTLSPTENNQCFNCELFRSQRAMIRIQSASFREKSINFWIISSFLDNLWQQPFFAWQAFLLQCVWFQMVNNVTLYLYYVTYKFKLAHKNLLILSTVDNIMVRTISWAWKYCLMSERSQCVVFMCSFAAFILVSYCLYLSPTSRHTCWKELFARELAVWGLA